MKARSWASFAVMVITGMSIGEVCYGDFEYRPTTSVSFNINKDWECSFEEEVRFRDTGGEFYYHHSDLGVVYKSIASWIDLGVNFRKVYKKDSKGKWTQEDRPHLNATLKGKVFGLDVSDRSRLEYRDIENEKDIWRYRNKLTVRLPVELTGLKLQPFFAEEAFISMDGKGYNSNRVYGGFGVKVSKNVKGDIFYMWQADKSDGSWKDTNVIGTSLKFYF